MELPSLRQLDLFAPLCGTEEETRARELERKRSWVRQLKGLPEWTTKEEVLAQEPPELRPMT